MTIGNVSAFESSANFSNELDYTCVPRALDVLLQNHIVPKYIYSRFETAAKSRSGLTDGDETWAEYLLNELWDGLRDEPFGFDFSIDRGHNVSEQKQEYLELLSKARNNGWLLLLRDSTDQEHVLGGLQPAEDPKSWTAIGQLVLCSDRGILAGWGHLGGKCLPGDLTNSVTVHQEELWDNFASKLTEQREEVTVLTILPPESAITSL